METQVRTFEANVEDRDEWGFKGAFAAIHTASETSQTTFESKDCTGNYTRDVSSHLIKYKVQFWKDHQTQLDGKPSRALYSKAFIDSDGYETVIYSDTDVSDLGTDGSYEYSEIFTVDLGNDQAKRIASNTHLSKEDTIFNLIEFDLKRRVDQSEQ